MTGKRYHISLHAEVHALFCALKKNKEYKFKNDSKSPSKTKDLNTVYVVRLMNNNATKYNLGNSKPCENCQKYLALYKVKKIKYTDIIDGQNVLCEMKLVE